MAWTGTVAVCRTGRRPPPALPLPSCAAVFTRPQGSLWDPAWRIFNLAAGTIQDPVLSRPGALSSAPLARSARLARWQAAHTDGYWGTADKQLSHKQRHFRGTAALPRSRAAHWPTCFCGGMGRRRSVMPMSGRPGSSLLLAGQQGRHSWTYGTRWFVVRRVQHRCYRRIAFRVGRPIE
jgi:hypothetical protein